MKKIVLLLALYIVCVNVSAQFTVRIIVNDMATKKNDDIYVAGDFNNWAHDQLKLRPEQNGFWSIEIPMLPRGTYHYKFFIDERMWAEDIENQYREPDGVAGWNSILVV